MDVRASTKFSRHSPKRLRFVATLVRGLDVLRAEEQLTHLRRRSVDPMKKLLAAAVADAEHNFDLLKENLYIKSLLVNEGPRLKRFRPRAFGRATPVERPSAHLFLILGERTEGVRGGRARREQEREKKKEKQPHTSQTDAHPRAESDKQREEQLHSHAREAEVPGRLATRHHEEGRKGPKQIGRGFLKKLFSRKAG